ncbi:MAG TPA: glycosyltransferase family 9 protein [Burkholderiales bacterium]|nr:glycosyltransferase family 9 protein [Burkholderiales bacterium]
MINAASARNRSGALRSLAVRCVAWVAENAVLLYSRPRNRGSDVLLVRLDAIGDFILWIDAAKELRALLPDRRLVLVANSIWADVAACLPFWDEVWPVDVSRLKRHGMYRWKLMAALRKRGFDIAIQPTHSRSFMEGDTVVRASGARDRIGAAGDDRRMLGWQRKVSDGWYTRLVPSRAERMTELERNAEFLRNLGREGFAESLPRLPKLAELPADLRIRQPYLILFPGASWSGRQWPPARFAEIADGLVRETGLMAIVCGSEPEAMLCQQVVESSHANMMNFAGKTSLPQFVELVREARLLIGNETSAIHIAASVGTPAVCILGGGHYGRFLPYGQAVDRAARLEIVIRAMPCFGCDWQCSQPHEPGAAVPCIGEIPVREVMDASRRALGTQTALALA